MERDILSEVFTALPTSLPAHWGSLVTESFAYCPCFPLTLQTWCSIHAASVSRENKQPQLLQCHQLIGSSSSTRSKVKYSWVHVYMHTPDIQIHIYTKENNSTNEQNISWCSDKSIQHIWDEFQCLVDEHRRPAALMKLRVSLINCCSLLSFQCESSQPSSSQLLFTPIPISAIVLTPSQPPTPAPPVPIIHQGGVLYYA